MPKIGGYSKFDDENSKKYYDGVRRFKFKPNPRSQVFEHGVRQFIRNDPRGYATNSGCQPGSRTPVRKFNKPLPQSIFGWYQVTIVGGGRYTRDEVINALYGAYCQVFIPQYWQIERNTVVFYLNDYAIAKELSERSEPIPMSDGYCLHIYVSNEFPRIIVDESLKNAIKAVMLKRYDQATKCMDLKNFYIDSEGRNVFCALIQPNVMATVLNIISEYCSDVEIINLSNNLLTSVEAFKYMSGKLPNLRSLLINDNNIKYICLLKPLRDLKLFELDLRGNPLVGAQYNHQEYVVAICCNFPMLKKLDGLTFIPSDLVETNTSTLPQIYSSYFNDLTVAANIQSFLKQFLPIFDSDDRRILSNIYHEKATMSISVAQASQAGKLPSFWKFNRNLNRLINRSYTQNFNVGCSKIVSVFENWPRIQHEKSTFTADLIYVTDNVLKLMITGTFANVNANPCNNIYNFERILVLLRYGKRLIIGNDMIYITKVKQMKTVLPDVGITNARTLDNGDMQPTTSAAAMRQIDSGAESICAAVSQLTEEFQKVDINANNKNVSSMELSSVNEDMFPEDVINKE